jgi:hypothetical protein
MRHKLARATQGTSHNDVPAGHLLCLSSQEVIHRLGTAAAEGRRGAQDSCPLATAGTALTGHALGVAPASHTFSDCSEKRTARMCDMGHKAPELLSAVFLGMACTLHLNMYYRTEYLHMQAATHAWLAQCGKGKPASGLTNVAPPSPPSPANNKCHLHTVRDYSVYAPPTSSNTPTLPAPCPCCSW